MKRIGLATLSILVVLSVVVQLVLPVIAVDELCHRLARYGPVLSAQIHAVPAIELLWGHAQSATVRTGALELTQAQAVEALREARGVGSVKAFSSSVKAGPWRFEQVQMIKSGDSIRVEAIVSISDLRTALPAQMQVQRVATGQGGQMEVTLSGSLLGDGSAVAAVVKPWQGELVAEPKDSLLLGGLARVTLFADPHLRVRTLALRGLPGRSGWRLYLEATIV